MADVPVLEAAAKPPKVDKADKAEKADKADKAKKADKPEGAAPAGGKRKLIFIAIGVVVLAGLGAGGWLMLGGKHDAPAKGKDKAAAAQKESKDEEEEKADPKAPPLFVALDPPFVVNFQAEQTVRFLQVSAQIMSHDLETIELLKTNDPIIRNDLLLLLGNQNYQTISTLEGKEALRAQALETVRNVVKNGGGRPKRVEAVYFTSFVMQ